MNKTVSVLIPTRGRPEKLLLAIDSIRSTTDPNLTEILLRGDDDDETFQQLCVKHGNEWDNVFWFSGPRLPGGYASLTKYYEYLSKLAYGDWIMIFNDDARIEGPGWDALLATLPTKGLVCHPNKHQLNGSGYHTDPAGGSPFPIVPNFFWKGMGYQALHGQVDIWLHNIAIENGWKGNVLPMTVIHKREIDVTLPKERF